MEHKAENCRMLFRTICQEKGVKQNIFRSEVIDRDRYIITQYVHLFQVDRKAGTEKHMGLFSCCCTWQAKVDALIFHR